jgi:hypothetical protein
MSNTPQVAASDFNMERLSTRDLASHLAASVQLGENIAIFGLRGSGKTAMSKVAIAEGGFREVYVNLSVLERVDMGGYPNIMGANLQRKFVDFLLPQFYEYMIEGDQKVVALLDEVDKADPSLWAPLLEFTQFKSINGRKLPNLHGCIMTGNLISEGGSRPSLPLLDRAEKYLIEADPIAWLDWAGKTGSIHPSISAYISDHPQDLFGAQNPEDRYADPSPRGWHRASDILRAGEKLNWSPNLLNKKVSGCVGKDVGIRYAVYYEHYQQLLPLVEKIFKDESIREEYAKLEPTKQMVCCMIACARLANQLDIAKDAGATAPQSLDFVGRFLQHCSPENQLVAVRSQIQVPRMIKWDLDEHKEWSGFIADIDDRLSSGS